MLPHALKLRLDRAPRWVVAPVGLGYAQRALRDWADARSRVILDDPADAGQVRALILPARRSDIARLPAGWDVHDVLFLSEQDVTLTEQDWEEAVGGPVPYRRAAYLQARGWPEGAMLAAAVAESAPDVLVNHPLVRAHLDRLLPSGAAREHLTRAARTPLLLPSLLSAIGVNASDTEELHDRGFLYADQDGYRLPSLLRQHLRAPDPRGALDVAHALLGQGRVPEGLTCLAEAGCWDEYLMHLALYFKASMGEAALRGWLRSVPPAAREHPAFLYLSGLLERVKGEFARAEAQYARALLGADTELAPTVHNARGVTLALMSRNDEALDAFERATRAASALTAAEAWHNRAGLLLQQQRYAEAETSLQEAISAFRASADYAREARTLQLLGTFYYKRGLLMEAERTYAEALHLLRDLGNAPTALVRANFAEVLCLIGERERAERELDLAAREAGSTADARAWGWTQLNAALLRLSGGDLDGAHEHLTGLLLAGNQEKSLLAEAHLLLARVHRQREDASAALAALEHASTLGLRARLEKALVTGEGFPDVIDQARREEARYELAVALLHHGGDAELREALGLIRAHRYRTLLDSPAYAQKLIPLSEHDASLRELFPIHVTLLGQFRVRFLGRTFEMPDFPTRKSAALFLALALHARPQTREALADRFWPGAKNPVGSLQTAIYHLRAALGAPIVRNERGLLSLAFPVTTDLQELERTARTAVTLPVDAAVRGLQGALRACGPFLPEFTDDFGEERAEAEETQRRYQRELARLSPAGSDAERDALRALLASDPFDLTSRARLVELYESRGDADAAEAERRRLAELERELLT